MALTMGAVPCSFAQEIAPTGEYKKACRWAPGCSIQAFSLVRLTIPTLIKRPRDPSADTGTSLRVGPRLTGTYDGGIHKTTFYGVVDARFFNADNVAASAGFCTLTKRCRISYLIFMAITRDRQTFSIARYSSTTTQLVPLLLLTSASRSS